MPHRRFLGCWFLLLIVGLPPCSAASATVQATQNGDTFTLSNEAVAAVWSGKGGALLWQGVTNRFRDARPVVLDTNLEILATGCCVDGDGGVGRSRCLAGVENQVKKDALQLS